MSRTLAARKPRGHPCQCGDTCHGPGPCNALIERSVYAPQHDPFSGERYPTTTPAQFCGPCAEQHLAAETGA